MLTPCEAGFYCLALSMQTVTDNVCDSGVGDLLWV